MVAKSPMTKEVPSVCSRFLFCWLFPMFYNGYKRDLEESDLVPARRIYDSKISGDLLERKWMQEEAVARAAGRAPSFGKVLIRTYFWSCLRSGFLQFMYVAIRTLTPLLFAELLSFWSVNTTMSRETATYYGLAMILANWLGAFCNHHGNLLAQQFGMKLRVATSSLMFRKIMRMDNGSLGETTAGKVVNLLSNDLQRFDMAFLFINYIWIIPLQLAAVCFLGYLQAGVAAIIGLVCLIVIALPIQGVLSQILGKVRFKTAEKTDNRIKIMSEVINGIQVIKMYGWEVPFEKVVGQKRKEELKYVNIATHLRTVFLGFMMFTERTALFLTILVFILFGNSLSANVIYPLQQFMNAAQINITLVLPMALGFTAELVVAIKRVQEFLSLNDRKDLASFKQQASSRNLFKNMSSKLEEDGKAPASVRPLSYERKTSVLAFGEPKHRRSLSLPNVNEFAVELRDVSCSWTGDPNALALKNVSLRIRKGKMCAVIGAVGAGKSSFLQLLLKELEAASGSVSVSGRVSYACQEAWLFPSTVRENVLFGLPYDAEKYKKVCRACALEKDFKQFPFGDQTLVGERGVSLSGGQRARINLARAVYREADIYLLDDPLSAVDANVGRKLFEGCINGYLSGRTRILVTHQIHFLKAADYIVVMNNGSVENMGTFDELVDTGKDFAALLAKLEDGKDKDTESIKSGGIDGHPRLLRSISEFSEKDEGEEFEAQTQEAEERQSGDLKWAIVVAYFRAGGGFLVTTVTILLVLLAAGAGAGVDYWLSYWTNQIALFEQEAGDSEIVIGMEDTLGMFTTAQYLIIYGCIVGACILLTNIRVLPFVHLCVSASKNLHNMMFSTMLKGIMRFFDTSSSGRILNRFTKDMGALDEILPRTLLDVFQIYSTLAAVLVLNVVSLYYTVVPSAVLLVLFYLMVRVYMKTAQGVKRLEGTTKSPVFGMVTSSLNGIATIRSAGAEQRLIDDFDRYQDLHTCAWNGYLGGGTTFGFYLDTLCLVYLGAIIMACIYLGLDGVIPVGSVGLVVTQSNTLTAMLQHGARMLVEFIAQLTSVERVIEYTNIETEDNLLEGPLPIPSNWPTKGKVEFQNVSLRYAPDEAPVLKNLNIEIESGWKGDSAPYQKQLSPRNMGPILKFIFGLYEYKYAKMKSAVHHFVGIVGRTGAGKSSLISAMFRFAYVDGVMAIDGLDTSLIAKQELRTKISIIPQEPVLFSATIRYNLDPFGIYSDGDLWRALEQVEMKSMIPSLDFKVTEGGSNFSVGQRQLMCLSRAILRSNKLLIMDEATANVDPQTDNLIQQTIRRQFATCTVLTIAHRLNTIMDSDRVLVMDSGRAVEFDHPFILLSDPNSYLSSMVRETGEKMGQQLLEVAKTAYFQDNMKPNAK